MPAKRLLVGFISFLVALVGLLMAAGATASPAAAVVAPVEQRSTAGVTADGLPTVQIDGVVWDQEIVGDTVYAGGQFTNARPAGAAAGVNQSARSNILAYNIRTGELITSFAPVLNGVVKDITASPDGSRIYVGGNFTTVNGTNRYRLAAFSTSTGALITTFAAGVNAGVNAITVTSTAVYVGGAFTTVGSASRPHLAAFNPNNGALLGWAPTVDNGGVNAMVVTPDKTKVIVAGSFGIVNASTATGLASIDITTGALLPFAANQVVRNYGSSAAMLSLSTDGTNIYSAGYWYGGTGNFEGVLAADPNTGDIKWLADCHGDTYDAAAAGGVVYAVSHWHYCSNIGGFPDTNPRNQWYRSNAMTVEAKGTVAPNGQGGYYDFQGYGAPAMVNWFPTMEIGTFTGQSQAGWTTEGNSQYVVQGGEFLKVNGVGQQGLVRFAIPSLATKKQGPRLTGAETNPTLLNLGNGSVRVKWPTNWDRDDQVLSYDVQRQGSATPLFTTSATSQFWNRPTLSFTDSSTVAGQTYSYRISAYDADGNRVTSSYVSIKATTGTSAYVSQVIADGAIDYWRMGNTGGYPDYVGDLDLTAGTGTTTNAAGAINGDADGAATFDGTANGTSGAATTATAPDTFTAEAWFKTTTTSGGKIIGYGDSQLGQSGNYDRHVYLDDAGHIVYGVYSGGVRTVQSAGTYNDGQWHQVAAQLSPAGMVLYVDGIKVGGAASVTTGQPYAGRWRVGGESLGGWTNQPSSNFLAGSIDEVAVYPTALSAVQIRDHYTKSGRTVQIPAAPTDSYGKAVYTDDPTLYWRLDDATGPVAKDSSPNAQNGRYAGGVTYGQASPVTGANGKGVAFNGTENTTLASENAVDNPTVYTEELWFKTTTTNGGKLIGFGNSQTGTSDGYDRHVYLENSGQLTFGTYTGQTNTATTPQSYNDGAWHHMVASQGSAGMQLYLDGKLAASNPTTGAQPYTGYWRVGGDSTWCCQPWFNGTIDEVAVYDSVLTPAQVATHYQASPVAVNEAPVAAFTSACTDGACAFDATGSTDPDGAVASYAWTFGDGDRGTGSTPTHGYDVSGSYLVTLTVTDDQGATSQLQRTVEVTVPVANQLPVAGITTTCDELVCAFDATTSSDPDGSVDAYLWSFGDGTTSTEPTVEHTYGADGSYAVSLKVTDNRGGATTATKQVAVKANVKPVAGFTSSCTELECSFDSSTSSDADGMIAGYRWNFGDSTPEATAANPSHTFSSAGSYAVTLTVTDNRGASTSKTVTVRVAANQPPTASFTSSCTELACSFNGSASADPDGTIASYAWTFGNQTTGSGATASRTYATAGSYEVKLTVTDNSGATASKTATVTVTAAANQAPTAAFTATASGSSVAFDASASADRDGTIASYGWTFGDGSTGTGRTTSHSYAGTGTYPVQLTVTDNKGATTSTKKNVVVGSGAVVADGFSRTATKWGSAETGGAYTYTGTSHSTDGATGNVRLGAAGNAAQASLTSVSQQNVNVVVDVAVDKLATGGGTQTTLITRRAGTSDYRMSVIHLSSGSVRLNLSRVVNGTSTSLRDVNVPAATYTPGSVLRVRFTATGNGTTALAGKVWKAGTAEPTATQITASDTTAALQAPGSFAIYNYLSGSATNAPTTVSLDNLLVTAN